MQLINPLDPAAVSLPKAASVVTIGTFDGVHAGHRALLWDVVERVESGERSVVVTFRPHPVEVIAPEHAPYLLSSYEDKSALLEDCGVDVCAEVPFDSDFREWSAERFVIELLVERLGARHIVAGPDLRFGKGAAGDFALLQEMGPAHGFSVSQALSFEMDAEVVSSTRIRAQVGTGNMHEARRLLTRPHRLRGVVVTGHQRGRQIGFPTANLECGRAAIPCDGIYACEATLESGERFGAAVSIGTRPTFGVNSRAVEAYLLDFKRDIYGEVVALDFLEHLRGEEVYDSVAALIAQIERDVEATRRVLAQEVTGLRP
ncbi:MAG: riboflavin kinase/FMN adenylyltransferase [Myxococcota bacterium]|jgi:riboflavin kinase/FMN adenylyltransferase